MTNSAARKGHGGRYERLCLRRRRLPCSAGGRNLVGGIHSCVERAKSQQGLVVCLDASSAQRHQCHCHSLVVLDRLGIGLGHWGHSGRCCAEGLLEIQDDDGDGVRRKRSWRRPPAQGQKSLGSRDEAVLLMSPNLALNSLRWFLSVGVLGVGRLALCWPVGDRSRSRSRSSSRLGSVESSVGDAMDINNAWRRAGAARERTAQAFH